MKWVEHKTISDFLPTTNITTTTSTTTAHKKINLPRGVYVSLATRGRGGEGNYGRNLVPG